MAILLLQYSRTEVVVVTHYIPHSKKLSHFKGENEDLKTSTAFKKLAESDLRGLDLLVSLFECPGDARAGLGEKLSFLSNKCCLKCFLKNLLRT